jgi:hypothetical protein
MNSDPDTDLYQALKVNPDPDMGQIRIQSFDDQKLKKKKIQPKIFFISFLIKNCNLLMSKLQENLSALKREHPELRKMKCINFFLCLWVIFALLDPDTDPGTPLHPDPHHWLSANEKGRHCCTSRIGQWEGGFLPVVTITWSISALWGLERGFSFSSGMGTPANLPHII